MIILKIKDRKYGMRKMPPLQGSAFGLKVASLVSKLSTGKNSLAALQALQKQFSGVTDKPEAEMDTATAMTAGASILSLISNVDANELMAIFREAFSYEVYAEESSLSDPDNFDVHFQKYPGDLYVVAAWATYNHVADFFVGLGDGIKALIPSSMSKKVPASPSQKEQGSTTL